MNSPVRLSRFTRANSGRIGVSFEFFPPNSEEMDRILWESIERLAPLAPDFVSVTYGAGGTTRERTHATVKRILAETPLIPAAHLTCIAATREEIDAIVRTYHAAGVRHIVALRGDPLNGAGEKYAPHPGGYNNAADLAAGIKRISSDFEISVSAYPEKHPDSPTVEADIDMLKAKVDAGASRAITQFFFENDLYFRYFDRARHSARAELQGGHRFCETLRRLGAGLAGGTVPRSRQRCCHPQADRRGGGRRAGFRSRRLRRYDVPLLYDEPRRSRLCDLPPAGPATLVSRHARANGKVMAR